LVNSSSQPADLISFSIQHPDLTCGLVAPEDALAARLVEVSCLVDLSTVSSCEQSDDASLTQREDGSNNAPDYTTRDLYDSLAVDDQRAINEFVRGFQSGNDRLPSRAARVGRTKVKRRKPVEDLALFHKVLDASMITLIRGASKRPTGVKVLEGFSWLGLVNLAPGVFHMDYLKARLQD
jgi:hypothetical protein